MKAKGYFLAALSAITYGMIPLFAIPLKQMDLPFDTVLFYRFLLSAGLIGLFLLWRKVDLRMRFKEAVLLALLGFTYFLSSECLFLGYDYMSAGVASTILFLYPVLVALIMGLGFRERINGIVWGAIVLAFLGVWALNGGGGSARIPLVGFGIVFLSALTYALYMVIVNKSRLRGMQGMKVSFYSMAWCAFFFFGKSVLSGNFLFRFSAEVGVNLVLFALITTVVSMIALVYAIKIISSTPTAIMGSMEPLVAVAISVLLFQEPFTAGLAVGILLILVAVVLTVLSDRLIEKFVKK